MASRPGDPRNAFAQGPRRQEDGMGEFLGPIMGGLAQIMGIMEGAVGGGLPTMLAQLENAGMGEHVQSWVGHGDNMPITPEQLAPAFTPEQLQSWADQAGTTPDALLKVLAEALPQAIDHATPDGRLPAREPG
jgi:uncharacterized protein YidB (DUF937 family)